MVSERYEVINKLLLRAGEDLHSEPVMDLMPGAFLMINAFGTTNKRRAQITLEDGGHQGWISVVTEHEKKLIAKVEEKKRKKESKPRVVHENKTSHENAVLAKEILEASRAGNVDEIVEAVAAAKAAGLKPNLNCRDIHGRSGMMYAAAFGHKNVIAHFLGQARVEVNALDNTRKTALHHACTIARAHHHSKGDDDALHGELVTMLVDANADIESRDHNGCTALMLAVANGNLVTTKALLDSGANPAATDYEGNTSVDYAEHFDHPELTSLLQCEDSLSSSDDDDSFTCRRIGDAKLYDEEPSKNKNLALPPVPENISDSLSTASTSADEKTTNGQERNSVPNSKKKGKKNSLEGDSLKNRNLVLPPMPESLSGSLSTAPPSVDEKAIKDNERISGLTLKKKGKKQTNSGSKVERSKDDDSSAIQSMGASTAMTAKKLKRKTRSKGRLKEKTLGVGEQGMLAHLEASKEEAMESIKIHENVGQTVFCDS